jgi:hypothetical protein
MLRDYMTILNILLQNKNVTFEELIEKQPSQSIEPKDEEKEIAAPAKIFSATDIEF